MDRVRKLKIHSKTQIRSQYKINVSEIRLEGKWLAELGFLPGDYVEVEQESGKLVISLQLNAPVQF